MAVYRPNVSRAGAELALIIIAGIAGFMTGEWKIYAAVAAVGVGFWLYTRRQALADMAPQRRYSQGALAIAIMLAILAGAFALGIAFRPTS